MAGNPSRTGAGHPAGARRARPVAPVTTMRADVPPALCVPRPRALLLAIRGATTSMAMQQGADEQEAERADYVAPIRPVQPPMQQSVPTNTQAAAADVDSDEAQQLLEEIPLKMNNEHGQKSEVMLAL